MKRIYLIVFIILFGYTLFSQQEKAELIKRKIVIFPFYNENSVKEYDYLENIIRDAFKAKLQAYDIFLFSNFSDVDNELKNRDRRQIFYDDDTIIKTALRLKSDVVITGRYVVIQEKIMIVAKAVDVLQKVESITVTKQGGTGVEIFSLIEDLTKEMSGKISKSFPQVDKSLFEKLLEEQQKIHKVSTNTNESSKKVVKKTITHSYFMKSLAASIACSSAGLVTILIPGTIPLAVGLVLREFYNDLSLTYTTDYINITNGLIIFGGVTIGIGAVLVIVGIIMAPVASYYYKKWKAESTVTQVIPFFDYSFDKFKFGVVLKL